MAYTDIFEPQRDFESYPVGSEVSVIGNFDWKIYENTENGYKIYTFDIEKIIDTDGSEYITSGSISVTGYYEVNEVNIKLPCRIEGTVAIYKGEKQLSATKVLFIEPATIEGIIAFLGSGIIKGVGEKTAIKIVKGYKSRGQFIEGFGEDTLEIIKNQHMQLTLIKGITADKAQVIHDSYMENMEYQNIMLFFQKYGISPNKAMKIYNAFKGMSVQIAQENPYAFMSIRGFGFRTCDEISRKMGLDVHSPERIDAGIRHTMSVSEMEGHCYLLKSQLVSQTIENLNIYMQGKEARLILERCSFEEEQLSFNLDGLSYSMTAKELSDKLQQLDYNASARDSRIIVDSISGQEVSGVIDHMLKMRGLIEINNPEIADEPLIYSWQMYNMERETAAAIGNILQTVPDNSGLQVDKLIEEFEDLKGFKLEEMQRTAIESVFNTNMLILTGSAGSGKTTTVEGMIYVLSKVFKKDEEELSFMLAAPTGKAAKRLTEVTGFEAKTVHRLLQFSFEGGGFYYKSGNNLPYKLLVIDECSMLSIDLAHALFTAISPGTKVIMIGDVQQLPSVGAGNVLNDMIKSGAVNVVELNVIKRQADGSGIISNASRIIRGEMPQNDNENKDFFIIEESDKFRVIKRTLEAITRLMDNYDYSIDDIQVICPQKTSEIGTYEMNKAIQQLVNPPSRHKKEVKRGNSIFRAGDKVIHLTNNYEAVHYQKDEETGEYLPDESTGVFNGDIGKIIDIIEESDADETGTSSQRVAVQYDDFIILYEKPDLEDVDLAYSLTVHKMQGSQCDAAIILCHMRNFVMLNRNLGYTALTRAKKMACIIGQSKAISVMVENVRVTNRNTMLAFLLSQLNK